MFGFGKDLVDAGLSLKKAMEGERYDLFSQDYSSLISVMEASIIDMDEVIKVIKDYEKPKIAKEIQCHIFRMNCYAQFLKNSAHTKYISSLYNDMVSELAKGMNSKKNFAELEIILEGWRSKFQAFVDVTKVLNKVRSAHDSSSATQEEAAAPQSTVIVKRAAPLEWPNLSGD